jgi:hypothetical protein
MVFVPARDQRLNSQKQGRSQVQIGLLLVKLCELRAEHLAWLGGGYEKVVFHCTKRRDHPETVEVHLIVLVSEAVLNHLKQDLVALQAQKLGFEVGTGASEEVEKDSRKQLRDLRGVLLGFSFVFHHG